MGGGVKRSGFDFRTQPRGSNSEERKMTGAVAVCRGMEWEEKQANDPGIAAAAVQQHWMLRARRMQMAPTFFLVADLA